MKEVKNIEIRMYGTGTGDCFVLKFNFGQEDVFTMMFDAGTWKGPKARLNEYVTDLKEFVDNKVDVLVISHEHKDHVYLFHACEEQFTTDFKVGEVWMAWSENEEDELAIKWKKQFGQKKQALAMASEKINAISNGQEIVNSVANSFNKENLISSFKVFSNAVANFNELHFDGDYKEDLKGMKVVKEKLDKERIRYFNPGDIETLSSMPGINFYFLAPSRDYDSIKQEHGHKKGDTYEHNKILRKSDSFSAAVIGNSDSKNADSPFEERYFDKKSSQEEYYQTNGEPWRKIDYDWLMAGAGSLALRLNTGLNNLSMVVAIEIEKTGDVLLFTGDAEFGNWDSWHNIEWDKRGANDKHFTEDLLNRTIFYKVAHHLSNNGTAKDKGFKMMTSDKLVSMASLDYDIISSNWKSTMPNRGILKDLIEQTKGRLIIMNEKDLFFDFNGQEPLGEKIKAARSKLSQEEKQAFEDNFKSSALYKQYQFNF